MLVQQQARWLLENGRENEARMLLAEAIRSDQIQAEKKAGIEMSVEDQVELMIQWFRGGAGTGQLNDASLSGFDFSTE
jgi:hypothetical protein